MDSVETDSEFASAGEMWLELQNRIQVAADQSP
jgi:plasmid maintenance system antidote protein VapI